jgi:hypothetical protein
MNIHGLRIDAQAIGNGIYAMICDHGEEAIVAFGMIPKWAMDTLEKELRDKITHEALKQVGITDVESLGPDFKIDDAKLDAIIRPIVHEISIAIYRAAKNAGKMIV